MPFTRPVVLRCPDDESNNEIWIVQETFIYISDRYKLFIEVPAGFKTDLASVPRWFPIAWALYGGKGNKAAVVHDWIYHHNILNNALISEIATNVYSALPKEWCDNIFYDAMIESKVPYNRAYAMYQGVNLFGSAAYMKEK